MIQDIRTYLLADAGVSAAVGGQRIHVGVSPQGSTTPYCSIFTVSALRPRPLNSDTTPNLTNYRIQIDIFGTTAQSVNEVADLIISRMDSASRTVSGTTLIIVATLEGRQDGFSSGPEQDSDRHKLIIEFMISTKEA